MKAFRVGVVALLVAVLVAAPLPPTDQSGQPGAVISQPATAWAQEGGFWQSGQIEGPVSMVALSWEGEEPETVFFRTKKGSRWGPWTQLPISDEHLPDPNSPESDQTRPSTEAVWVGDQDGVQYRVRGGSPRRMQAIVIDTVDVSKPKSFRFTDLLSPRAASGIPPQPTIRPRSQWDPSNSCEPRARATYNQITHAFVHHTTGTNSYTQSQVPGRILGICLFHRDTRGWNDIAYNFLIDRFGNIWEGRAGGIDRGVQGGHTAGFNSYSTGIAFLGDHRTTAPTPAARAALQSLLAWKFGVHNIDPTAVTRVVSKGSGRYPEGTPVSMRAISAHIDAQLTACPGEACLAHMGNFRSGVASRWTQEPLSRYQSPIVADFTGNGQPEAAIYRPSDGRWRVTNSSGSTSVWATFSTRSGWGAQLVGDFTGNGRGDIANYHPSNGTWWVSRSTGSRFSTTNWARYNTRTGWATHLVGDFTGNGRDDIVSYHASNGTWWVSASTGSSFASPRRWATYNTRTGWATHVVGDFNGDGRDDIASYHPSNGTWWVSLSTGSSFSAPRRWATFNTRTGWQWLVGDFTGNGRDDIANHHPSNSSWWVSRSTGRRFETTRWATTATFDHISHFWAQDVNSNGRADILAFDAYNGHIRRLRSSGSSFQVQRLANTPWRTTLSAQRPGPTVGGSSWVYFGQEFGWIRITGLSGSSASAVLAANLPRS